MENIINESIDIPVAKKSYLEKAIAKINRKAVKMGCLPLDLSFDNDHVIDITVNPYTGNRLVNPWKLEMCTAHLDYVIPIIDGYELVAKLDIYPTVDGGSEVIISAVPNYEIPAEWQDAKTIKCDHCGWDRRRNHSILLRHVESGEYKEVGSTCVKDFFGIDPKGFLMMASIKFESIIGDISEETWSEGGGVYHHDLMEVLSLSAASIIKWGWLSKGKAWELNNKYEDACYISTASHVCDNLEPVDPKMEDALKVIVETEDVELAEKTLEYFTNLDPKGNDYLLNCCKIVKIGYVPNKHIGLVASMVSAYQREMVKIEKMEKKAEDGKQSEWQGELKQRLKSIKVVCTYKRHLDTDFGESTLYAFKDAAGNVYKTFYSGYSWSVDVDEAVMIDGTVKKHAEFNGTKETMLNRVAVKECPEDVFAADEFAVA